MMQNIAERRWKTLEVCDENEERHRLGFCYLPCDHMTSRFTPPIRLSIYLWQAVAVAWGACFRNTDTAVVQQSPTFTSIIAPLLFPRDPTSFHWP